MNYYNESDPQMAAWLRELIREDLIAPGEVDERSIEDVVPNELHGYKQCHFFAGIGVWSYALRLSGVPDDFPIWTGSCPCQPFSTAGKGAGFADERHLWPSFRWLISQCRPQLVLGEQVAGKAGEAWLDVVQSEMELEGYTCGAAVTAACGFGAPHMRKRIYWVAHSHHEGSRGRSERRDGPGERAAGESCLEREGGMGDAELISAGGNTGAGSQAQGGAEVRTERNDLGSPGADDSGVVQPDGAGPQPGEQASEASRHGGSPEPASGSDRPGPVNGFWGDADWLFCRDGKWRPTEPSIFPLADGSPSRVGLLRGAGNAIVAQQAQAFIESVMEVL